MFTIGPFAVAAIMGGAQMGIGLLQRRAAKRRRERAMRDMEYDIPSATTEIVQSAREGASQTEIPGAPQIRARTESEMAAALAKGESVADTASDVYGLYSKLYGSKMGVERDLAIKGAEFQYANELELRKSLGLMAEAQNQQFHYNRYVPFLSNMQFASEQAAGGSANIAGGLQTAYSGWMNKWMMDEYGKIFGYGNNNQANTDGVNTNYIPTTPMQSIETPTFGMPGARIYGQGLEEKKLLGGY
jgi:hypothetical protein